MTTRSETQRKNRATEGHPQREAMFAWNKGSKGKAARKKYLKTDNGKNRATECRSIGGTGHKLAQAKRKKTRDVAHKARTPWTNEQDRKMLELIADGYTNSETGAALGRSLQAIEHRRNKLRELENEIA